MNSAGTHIVQSFDQQLQSLTLKLDTMCQKVNTNFSRSTYALLNQDQTTAADIVEHSASVHKIHMSIEDQALNVLALRQPVAIDLRTIFLTIKIATHLSAMSSDIRSLCQRILRMKSFPNAELLDTVKQLCQATEDMLIKLPELINQQSPALAQEIFQQDDVVDHVYYRMYRIISDDIKTAKQKAVSQDLHLMFITKNIERIADNVAIIANIVHQQATGSMINDITS